MGEFVRMIALFWRNLLNKLSMYTFEVNGLDVSIAALIFALLVIFLVVSVFWKGART